MVESGNDIIEAILISGQGGNFCTGNSAINFAGIAPYVDVPNAFTPNSDSKNDVFKAIAPEGVTILEMTIVNRWGRKYSPRPIPMKAGTENSIIRTPKRYLFFVVNISWLKEV